MQEQHRDEAQRRIRYLTDSDTTYEASSAVTKECVDLVMLHVFLAPSAAAARYVIITAGDCSPRRLRIALTKKLEPGATHDFVLPVGGLPMSGVQVYVSTSADAIVGAEAVLRTTAVAIATGGDR